MKHRQFELINTKFTSFKAKASFAIFFRRRINKRSYYQVLMFLFPNNAIDVWVVSHPPSIHTVYYMKFLCNKILKNKQRKQYQSRPKQVELWSPKLSNFISKKILKRLTNSIIRLLEVPLLQKYFLNISNEKILQSLSPTHLNME